jgi:hypothetical protein
MTRMEILEYHIERGYWSGLGRDAVAISINSPTMNFEGFTISIDEGIEVGEKIHLDPLIGHNLWRYE